MGRLISIGQYSVPTISSSSNGPVQILNNERSPARKLTLYIVQVTGDIVRLRVGIYLSLCLISSNLFILTYFNFIWKIDF